MLHIKFVHEGAELFECEQCDKKFMRREDLLRHEFLHEGVRPFKCDQCDKTFSIKSALRVHSLTHQVQQPINCDECGGTFLRHDLLLRHMRLKHRETLAEIMADGDKQQQKKKKLQRVIVISVGEEEEPEREVEVEAEALAEQVDGKTAEDVLLDNLAELLTLLVDEETLKSFGWPDESVEKLLEAVIRRCGHEPVKPSPPPSLQDDDNYNVTVQSDHLRENAKLLFTVVIDDVSIKSLLDDWSVDQVVAHVLNLAKSE